MKKIIKAVICFLFYSITHAQNFSVTMNLCSGEYNLTSFVDLDKSIKIKIVDINDTTKKKEYNFYGNNINEFMAAFQNKFLLIDGLATKCTQTEKDAMLSAAIKVWYGLYGNDIAPKAGILNISDSINLHAYIKDSATGKLHSYKYPSRIKVQDVHIEINNGYIETIYADVIIKGVPLTYVNFYGIGFATFENYSNLEKIQLIELHGQPFYKKNDDTKPWVVNLNSTYIKLSDLLIYLPELEVDRRDYSPRDTAFTLRGGQSVALFKEQTGRLFEARFFSDFVGLQEDKPNGLIQTEVTKRVNINSVQWKTTKWAFPIFKSWGIFQYISPTITLSKLEQHNKRLLLGDLDSIRMNPGTNNLSALKKAYNRYVTPLDLYQHQSFSGGFNLNFLYFSNHSLKYTLDFNLGGRLGITPISDSLTTISQSAVKKTGSVNETTVNSLQLIPQATVMFLPEERIKFAVSYQLFWIKPFANNIQLLRFSKDDPSVFSLNKSWLNTIELLLTYDVNPNQKYNESNGKLFGRLRFTSEDNNFHTNFAQIQIGYAVFILGNKR